MLRGMPSRVLSLFAMAVLAVLAGPRPSLAAPPANDNFVDAIQVSTLPFTDSVDLVDATTEPGEFLFTNCSGFPLQRTVWYRISFPTTKVVTLDLNGSDSSAVLFVWQQFGTNLFFT